MSNRSKVLRTLLVLGIVACIAGAGVFSAFSSQTENPGNVITAGTVTLEDNDGGSALYALTGAKPGDSKTSCIQVTYKGKMVTVPVKDQCPGCGSAQIDLGKQVFVNLAGSTDAGIIQVTWKFVKS